MRKITLTFAVVIALMLQNCSKMKEDFMVIGHRGAMGHEVENTLASVQAAMDLGVDMIEIDVFKIKSGEIVVFHDERVERLTNGGGRIEEYNIVDTKALTIDGGHKIPMLQEVLKLIDKQVKLNIELKCANCSDRVNHIVKTYIRMNGWTMDQFLISSFNWDELREMRAFNPDIPIAVLTDSDPLEAIAVAQELNAVAINPNYKTLNADKVAAIQQAGFKVFPYTVNDGDNIATLIDYGVDGIISDYPERVR